jgi:hypothetical protein
MRARLGFLTAATLTLAACTGGSGGTGTPGGGDPAQPFTDEVMLVSSLVSFDACDDLLSYVKEHALDVVGPWGLSGGGMFPVDMEEEAVGADGAGEAAVAPEAAADSFSSNRALGAPVEGQDYSGTNVQEAGVDEPDTVKTDGERLYLIRGEYLDIVDVTGASPELVSSVDVGGWGHQMLRDGDRLLVFGQVEGGVHPLGRESAGFYWPSGTTLSLYDVGDPANPDLVSTLELDGSVASARLVDGVARVVLNAKPVGLPFVSPEGSGLRAERAATERNRQIIEESTVDNWIPYYIRTGADGRDDEGALLPCDQIHHPRDFSGLGTTTVLSLDLDGDLSPGGGAAVLAGGETVYASAERLYVATNRWVDWEDLPESAFREANERYTTDVHAFDITDADAARYIGSGSVRGHVLNQWSMSSHDGVLRVATTDGSPWWGARGELPATESFVTAFAERDGELAQLGQVGGLGKGERIYAVRFMGDVGYVVTFRQTDPLYTLDLSDPENPTVLGELKILGYSAYLHPVGDDLVLGVGQDADEDGRTRGLQLSLFDVSDLADPQRIHQVTLEDAYTEAEWDHHAFLHWPATGLTVIPYQSWSWDEKTEIETVDNGALAYTLDRSTGFTDVGRVTHLPDQDADSRSPRYWDVSWRASIQRSVVIGGALYTISDLGVQASDLTTLDEESWLTLPPRNG